MSFSSFQEFLAMGGHGLYVWLSYGAAVIILLYNVISVRVAERRFMEDARDQQRRRRGSAESASGSSSRAAAVTGDSRSS